MTAEIYSILNELVSSCNQTVKVNRFTKAKFKSPWMSLNILRKFDKRTKLYRMFKRRPYDRHFKEYYNRFCDNLAKEIDLTKNSYYENKIKRCEGDVA